MLAPPPLPRTLDASIRDLQSTNPKTRVSAIADLLRHARADADVAAAAIPLLLVCLDDAQAAVRAAAAVGLADLRAKEAVLALVRAASDDDAYVRQMALSALGELRDARALPCLRRALADKRPEMRYQAIIALSRVEADDDELDRALVTATHDDDDAVVHIALRVAEERQDEGKTASSHLLARARAVLAGETKALSLVAAIVLAKAGESDGHDLLLRVVAGTLRVPEKEDERAAVELVGELGLKTATPHLEKRAWGLMRHVSDTSAFHAKIALARLGHPRAIDEIMNDLDSKRPEVRAAAVVAAGRARVAPARSLIARFPAASVDPELVREALLRLDAAPVDEPASALKGEGEGAPEEPSW
jgi:HEAT repeat protein